MEFNEYQKKAARTINRNLTGEQIKNHALFEMAGELGEIHSLFQKEYQGKPLDREHLKKELGDLCWGIAELCTVFRFSMDEIADMNIKKLEKRYPNGFEVERSLNRAEGDI